MKTNKAVPRITASTMRKDLTLEQQLQREADFPWSTFPSSKRVVLSSFVRFISHCGWVSVETHFKVTELSIFKSYFGSKISISVPEGTRFRYRIEVHEFWGSVRRARELMNSSEIEHKSLSRRISPHSASRQSQKSEGGLHFKATQSS
eukprot:453433_1